MFIDFKSKIILQHVLAWLFYILYSTLTTIMTSPGREFYVWDTSFYILNNILLFYALTYIVIPSLLVRKKYGLGLIKLLIVYALYYGLHYLRTHLKSFVVPLPDYYYSFIGFFLAFFFVIVQFTAFALVYWYYHHSLRQQKEKVELEKRSHEIEVSFLKSQINEHFTYNMLNRFHTEASKYSEQLADGILSLSELMRYSVSEHENTMVTLSEEIKYTQMLIALNRQRLDNQVEVNFDIEGNLEQPWKIPHLCILTLVENAFKHGALRQAPLQLHLKVTQEQLWFSTKNKIKPSISEPSTGIGVKNLGRRLDLLCEGRAMLKARIEDEYFYTNLEIKAPCPPMGE